MYVASLRDRKTVLGRLSCSESTEWDLLHRHRCIVCVVDCGGGGGGGGCNGSEWHRWHEAPAVPRASDRHVAHSQPRTAYAKRGGGRERERTRDSVFLRTT